MRIESLVRGSGSGCRAAGRGRSHEDERGRVVPLALLVLKLDALIDDDLAVLADADTPALQRPRGGALEVDAADVKAAAVAGALELGLAFEPVGRAAKMGAGGAEGVHEGAALVVDVFHHPGVLILVAIDDLAGLVAVGEAGL